MPSRREVLSCIASLASGPLWAADEAAAFDAVDVSAALRALGVAAPQAADGALRLNSLDLVEDGATVEVGVASTLAGAQRLLLLVEKNPNPLAARFDLSERVAPSIGLRLKVAESCDWQAIAIDAEGRAIGARRHVDVTLGGCGVGEVATDLPALPAPPQATRIRVRREGDDADVRLLMSHVMETGLRKDAAGRPVPAWHIRDVRITLNGATVLSARWGTSISRNPYLQLRVRGVASGDKVGVSWTDNRGASRDDEAAVS